MTTGNAAFLPRVLRFEQRPARRRLLGFQRGRAALWDLLQLKLQSVAASRAQDKPNLHAEKTAGGDADLSRLRLLRRPPAAATAAAPLLLAGVFLLVRVLAALADVRGKTFV